MIDTHLSYDCSSPPQDEQDATSAIKFEMQFGTEKSSNGVVGVDGTTFSSNLYINRLLEILKVDLPVELLNMQLMIFKEQWSRYVF